MSLKDPSTPNSTVRHRIKEITLHPDRSKHPITLEISANGKVLHRLTTVESGQPLCWDVQTFPCDVRTESKIELKFKKSYLTSSDSEMIVEYTIPESTDQTSITRDGVSFPMRSSALWFASKKSTSNTPEKSLVVIVKFQDTKEAEHDYSRALIKARTMIETENGPLDRMGNARAVLKTILEFGGVVAELHPTAKLVVGLCAKAWQDLEKVQGQHDSLEKLINGMAQLRPFIESVKSRAKDVLKDTIGALLYLIEDASNFIINYVSKTSVAARTIGLQSYFNDSSSLRTTSVSVSASRL
ncbi:hypothetical protein BDV93DRAFT_512070 [Ceratobasidium sp. AG-I]|nr:hypothetical protein BDV93DRAFT_512070 [Ceratobasidium sp. AG-I]